MGINYQQRRDRARRKLKNNGVDALLVSSVANVTYLTGFTGEDSFLVVGKHKDVLVSDTRFSVQLSEECPDMDTAIRPRTKSLLTATAEVVTKMKVSKLAIESDSMSVATYESITDKLPTAKLIGVQGIVESMREIKDRHEIQRIRDAVWQAEKAIGVIRASLVGGQTELQVAADMEHQIRRFGGLGCSFPPIVAVGPRAALPHAPPSHCQIDESDFVLIDWGANEGLYVSDLTRVFVTGRISPKLELIYGVVLKAQRQAIEKIGPGVSMGDVDAAARSVIEQAGYGKRFGHGLGHGIGLQVHEAPRLVDKQQRPLRPGMVVTVEPGIYLPGWGGVRIEDDVLVTRDGHEVLSDLPKDLADCVVS